MRTAYTSGVKWESQIGYSRAIRINNRLEISGTVASDEQGNCLGKGNMYEQTKAILSKIDSVLQNAGYHRKDVVRSRIYVTDISGWQDVGKAHAEFFKGIDPVTSMIEVQNLIHSDYLVEIEISAEKDLVHAQ